MGSASSIKFPDAKRYGEVSFSESIDKRLGVMDQTAFTMCREHNLPVIVLSIYEEGAMKAAALGGTIGTFVGGD